MKNNSDLLTRGVENIIPNRESLDKLLQSGKKLHVYLGIDPTATRIHIGHAVPLRKLNELAKLGHEVTFLIGDFTALIGDTSDKDNERPVLTSEQIKENFASYKALASKVLDFSKVKIHFNSEWLSKLSFKEIIKLCQHFGAGDFVGRELIKKRLESSKHVGLHELLYPVMQGYDSYFMDTDIQLGGTDQTFNMQAGRVLQKALRQKESFIIANGFLEGTDGRKMSKSWNNAIWLDDSPNDMYGKIMSLKDDLIVNYFTLATSLTLEEIAIIEGKLKSGENPMTIKKQLARQIVTELHSESDADKAESFFQKTVQDKELPVDIPTITSNSSSLTLLELLKTADLGLSSGEMKRTIEQGGVELSGTKITSPTQTLSLKEGDILKFGKRSFYKIHINK
ncbi:MAG: tyrosine--tRNA ligase [bacterium]